MNSEEMEEYLAMAVDETGENIQEVDINTKHYYLDKNGNVQYCYNKDLQQLRNDRQKIENIANYFNGKSNICLALSTILGGATLGSLTNNLVDFNTMGLGITIGTFALTTITYFAYKKYSKQCLECEKLMEENDLSYGNIIQEEKEKQANGYFYR